MGNDLVSHSKKKLVKEKLLLLCLLAWMDKKDAGVGEGQRLPVCLVLSSKWPAQLFPILADTFVLICK